MFSTMLDISGQPVQVPDIQIDIYRKRGWRLLADTAPIAPTPTIVEVGGDTININTATTAELTALPLVGVKTARKIIAARPIADLADLTQRVEGVDWVTLEAQLSFAQDAAE
jgi:radical SAM superfamily enzyme with C-terminal helix-hairpin-helix motif